MTGTERSGQNQDRFNHTLPICRRFGTEQKILLWVIVRNILREMRSLADLEQEALSLPDSARAALAGRLLESLPAVLADDDEGVAEALRRDAEMESDPGSSITLKELRDAIKP